MRKLFTYKKIWQWREGLFEIVMLCLCVILFFLPSRFSKDEDGVNSETLKGQVLEVNNSGLQQFGIVVQGEQVVKVKLASGRFKNKVVELENILTGSPEFDFVYEPGQRILLTVSFSEGKIFMSRANGPDRLRPQFYLVALFIILLFIVLGRTGFRALISFIFSILMIWKVLIPLFLAAWDPVFTALACVLVMTGGIMFLVGGINRKGVVAFLGTLLGLGTTCILALLFSEPFYVNGMVRPFARTVFTMCPGLNITRIFLAGIYLTSCGAVMDLAMDIAAAMHEVHQKKPDISRRELFFSGLTVGRTVVGTMTTTLLFAYSGGWIFMMMWFVIQGIPPETMLNTNFFSTEILNTLVGSFGLITVAPFTALIGAFFYTHRLHR
jgi:uncharacterized membrane protein